MTDDHDEPADESLGATLERLKENLRQLAAAFVPEGYAPSLRRLSRRMRWLSDTIDWVLPPEDE